MPILSHWSYFKKTVRAGVWDGVEVKIDFIIF